MLNKIVESLASIAVNIDNLTYRICDFLNIRQLKVKNLNIDRFFSC